MRDNRVTGNHFVGIGVGSSRLLIALGAYPPSAFGSIEPNLDGTRVANNFVTGNGGGPPVIGFPSSDLLWDGSGVGNIWVGNRFETSSPGILPGP